MHNFQSYNYLEHTTVLRLMKVLLEITANIAASISFIYIQYIHLLFLYVFIDALQRT